VLSAGRARGAGSERQSPSPTNIASVLELTARPLSPVPRRHDVRWGVMSADRSRRVAGDADADGGHAPKVRVARS
jgi:hypothetical protein